MDVLIRALSDPDESTRLYAVQDMGILNDSTLAGVLIQRLRVEPSRVVADAIVFCLKQMDLGEAYPALFTLFQSEEAFQRNAAVEIFGSQKSACIGFLTAHLDHADREVRKLILDALSATGSPDAVLAIRASLHDPAINVRITAVEYLGQLQDRGSIPELLDILSREGEPMLRAATLETLARIGDAPAIARVIEMLDGQIEAGGNDLYFPDLLRLSARAGGREDLSRLMARVPDTDLYAEDILKAVDEAQRRFEGFTALPAVRDRLLSILKSRQVAERTRYGALELILAASLMESEAAHHLGLELIAEPGMQYAAVRMLAAGGRETGLERIRQIQKDTPHPELRRLCDELLAQASGEPRPGCSG